jgi:PAS domain S-box-containing protein
MVDVLQILVVAARRDEIERLQSALGGSRLRVDVRSAHTASEVDAALIEGCDAVIADDTLPDALALVAHARAADLELPIFVVGEPDDARVGAALAAGADHFVGRHEPAHLVASLERRLRVARGRQLARASDAAAGRHQHELRSVLDQLPFGILIRHGTTIGYVNHALASYYGVAAETLPGKPVTELLRPDHRDKMVELMAAVDRGESSPPWEFRFNRPDARVGVIEHSAPQRLTFGGLPAVMSTLRDVTERRAMQERLQMADRMAAVGTLASGVAHEINNPLACVTANLEVLREELAPPAGGKPTMPMEEILAALDDAREGAERVRLIVRDLRLFARGDAGEREPVDLGGVLQAAERMAGNMVKTRARVVQEHAPLPPVDGNATRLCQVFVNILVNAAQAIETGHPEENEVRVRAAVDGDRVVVEVRDTGVGIPPEVRARIFDPFFSTRGIGGGTGLGLSVCHGIVTSLGGEITVDDGERGRGTIVRVALPLWSR